MIEGSEAEVEAELENRRRRKCLEFAWRIAATRRREVALGIGSAIRGPQVKVAAREHHAGVTRAKSRHEALGQLERCRQLAPLHKGARLVVPVERLFRRVDRGDDHCLLLERRRGIEQTVAIGARTPNALRLVVVRVAAAPIEQALNAQAMPKQIDAGCERSQVAWLRLAPERADADRNALACLYIDRIGEECVRPNRDFVDRENAVAVL